MSKGGGDRGDRPPPAPPGKALGYLGARFDPDGPGWLTTEDEQRRFLEALAVGRAAAVAQYPDHAAWLSLVEHLAAASDDPEIAASKDVSEFVGNMAFLATAGVFGGIDKVFRELAAAFATKAAQAQRLAGEDTRERVLAAWMSDVQAGRPDRGRSPRIARLLRLPETTVKSAVSALRKAGRLPGQGAR